MATVWKYLLDQGALNTLTIPARATILHVAEQHSRITLWAEVDPSAPTERRAFEIVGTGNPITSEHSHHVGSLLAQGGALVFHIYESPVT